MEEADRARGLAALQLPNGAALDLDFCVRLAQALEAATWHGPAALPTVLPAAACLALLRRAQRLLKSEPTLLQVRPPEGAEVVVVGDLHGQFHDLLTIFTAVGRPSASRLFVFDGDFVDRGAWGLETVLLLCALKVAAPTSVALVRGNHESEYCGLVYGFKTEVLAKYGAQQPRTGEAIFSACLDVFSHLPLAAVVAGSTLVLHGGLPRAPARRATRRTAAPAGDDAAGASVAVASLADLAAASKGGRDPDPQTPDQRVAVDVLWSDPAAQPGVELGARPGDVGIRFGPDVTEAFLRDNGLRLILRGHEGPDARVLRPDMQGMLGGFTLDHATPAGKLYTVFSAPQYPQFGQQHQNQGAVAVLAGPGYDEPRFVQVSAAPRPKANAYAGILDTEDAEAAAASDEAMDGHARAPPAHGNAVCSNVGRAGGAAAKAAVPAGQSGEDDTLQAVGQPASLDGPGVQRQVQGGSSNSQQATNTGPPAPAGDSQAAVGRQSSSEEAARLDCVPDTGQLQQPSKERDAAWEDRPAGTTHEQGRPSSPKRQKLW